MSQGKPALVACTRFSDATFEENRRWKETNLYEGCIYGVSRPIKKSVPRGAWLYVVEMNNTGRGQIEGIGLIRNSNRNHKNHTIYNDHNYNLEVYGGKYRLSRAELLSFDRWALRQGRLLHGAVGRPGDHRPREESLLWKLENLLFRGKGHMKRGWGVTVLPESITSSTELALVDNITQSFKFKYAHTPE